MTEPIDDLTCRFYGKPKEQRQFCCYACWQRLPRELKAEFVVLEVKCKTWLRENPNQRKTEAVA
jgi:hypothetical protein